MNIKTYRAATMQEALRTIKAELGSDAVILSTKQHPSANGRLGSKMVEVTAAIDVEATRLRASQPTPLAVRPAMSINRPLDSEGSTPFGDMLRASLQAEVAPVGTARAMKAPEVKTNGRDHELNELHAELNRIREMLAARDGTGTPAPVVSKLMPYYERLTECGLDEKRPAHFCLKYKSTCLHSDRILSSETPYDTVSKRVSKRADRCWKGQTVRRRSFW